MDGEKIQNMIEKGYNCSQIVLCYFAEKYFLDEKMCKRLASGLESGMLQGKTCGAVTASYLVLGLEFSQDSPESRGVLKEKIKDFNKGFLEKEKSLSCFELLGLDVSTDQGLKMAVEEKLIEKVCPSCIFSAIEQLEKLL